MIGGKGVPTSRGDVSRAEDNGFDPTYCDFTWMLEDFGGRISNRDLSSGLQTGCRSHQMLDQC